MKAPLIFATVTALTFSLGAQAETRSTPSELRGYQACLDAATKDARGLVTDRTYLIDQRDGKRTYYINATAWENGARVDVAYSCQTSLSGRLLTTFEPTASRYVPAASSVQIAGQ
ncbi:MAG: hypothetical protein AB7I04_15805 [Pseudomonadales bacterium]